MLGVTAVLLCPVSRPRQADFRSAADRAEMRVPILRSFANANEQRNPSLMPDQFHCDAFLSRGAMDQAVVRASLALS